MKSRGLRRAATTTTTTQPDAFSGQDYFPEKMGRQTFYDPPDRGFEREIRKRLDYWAKLRRERSGQSDLAACRGTLTMAACCMTRNAPGAVPAGEPGRD